MTLTRYDLYGDGIGAVDYIQHMGEETTIVNAARVSFGKHKKGPLDDGDRRLIRYLHANHHTSPFEHLTITFRFVVPLFVRSQHHRHRVWSFNELSRRYTDENIRFYLPKSLRSQHDKNRQASNDDQINPLLRLPLGSVSATESITQHAQQSLLLYEHLLDNGVAREQARMVLPQNLYTEYYGTVDLHNLFGFLRLRLDVHAQWEIRRVAEACREIAKEIWPDVVGGILEGLDTK